MATRLTRLTVEEVSAVKRAAHQSAKILVRKSDDSDLVEKITRAASAVNVPLADVSKALRAVSKQNERTNEMQLDDVIKSIAAQPNVSQQIGTLQG